MLEETAETLTRIYETACTVREQTKEGPVLLPRTRQLSHDATIRSEPERKGLPLTVCLKECPGVDRLYRPYNGYQ